MSDERRSQQATLGCGTLILIGIIVLLVTQSSFRGLDRRVRELRADIQRLEQKIDELAKRLPEKKR